MKAQPMVIKSAVLSVALLMPVIAEAQDASRSCDLQQVMHERRQEVRERNSTVLNEGIGKKNADVLEAMTAVNVFEVCSDLFDQELAGLFSSLGFLGALLSNELKSECRDAVNKVRREYREFERQEIATIDDPFGILSNDPVYRENRTERVTVRDAIEMGKKAGQAARGVPVTPPGRGFQQAPVAPRSNGFGEGARNAIMGL